MPLVSRVSCLEFGSTLAAKSSLLCNGADCKSAGLRLQWFESTPAHDSVNRMNKGSADFSVVLPHTHHHATKCTKMAVILAPIWHQTATIACGFAGCCALSPRSLLTRRKAELLAGTSNHGSKFIVNPQQVLPGTIVAVKSRLCAIWYVERTARSNASFPFQCLAWLSLRALQPGTDPLSVSIKGL